MAKYEISVIIPTITGREEWVEKCIRKYELKSPFAEIIVIKDEISCGLAWQKGAAKATQKYVHFSADDIFPCTDWFIDAIKCLDEGVIPACNVVDRNHNHAWCDSPLGDMGLWPNVLVPFLTQDMLELGNWLAPFHYGTDDWVTYRAVQLGYKVQRVLNYKVVHHVASEGRNYIRRYGDVKALADLMADAGYLPPVYRQLEINLRSSPTGLDNVRINQLDKTDRDQQRDQLQQARWRTSQ